MKTFLKIIRVFLLKGLGAFVAFLFHLHVARVLSIDTAGAFFFFVSTITILSVMARAGTDQLALKYISIAWQQQDRGTLLFLFRTFLPTPLATGLVLAFLLVTGAWLFPSGFPLHASLLVQTMIAIPLFSLFFLNTEILKALHLPGLSQLLQNALVPGFFLLATLTRLWPLSRYQPETLYTVSVLLSCSLVLFLVWRKIITARVKTDGVSIRCPRFSLSFAVIATSAVLFNWGGVFFLGLLADAACVARFNVISRIAILIIFVSVAINAVFAPRFAILSHAQDHDGLRRNLKQSFLLSAGLSLFICFALALVSRPILAMFGNEYLTAAPALLILCLANGVNASFGTYGSYLMMSGHEDSLQRLSCITVVLFFLLVILMGIFSPSELAMSLVLLGVFCGKSLAVYFMTIRSLASR